MKVIRRADRTKLVFGDVLQRIDHALDPKIMVLSIDVDRVKGIILGAQDSMARYIIPSEMLKDYEVVT